MLRCNNMRTTIDIPDDLHRQAVAIARDTSQSLSALVVALMRRGLAGDGEEVLSRSPRTGLPVLHLGLVVTTEDVRASDDDL